MSSRVEAVVTQRCPSCRDGRIFDGFVRMNPLCPTCGIRFEREQGYFLGAMYFSYGMGVVAIGAPITWMIIRRADPVLVASVAFALLLVLSPAIFRYSRTLWLHFDNHFDPLDGSGGDGADPATMS